jgi:hypothetical protein
MISEKFFCEINSTCTSSSNTINMSTKHILINENFIVILIILVILLLHKKKVLFRIKEMNWTLTYQFYLLYLLLLQMFNFPCFLSHSNV